MARLIRDFSRPSPIPYTVAFYQPGFKDGHSVTAYGVDTVSPTGSRVLIDDNNHPNLREYITVNMPGGRPGRFGCGPDPGSVRPCMPDAPTGCRLALPTPPSTRRDTGPTRIREK